MWGPALMVSPVIEQGATSREVRFVHCKKCRRTFRRTFKEFRPDVEKYNITDEIFWLSSHVFFFLPC